MDKVKSIFVDNYFKNLKCIDGIFFSENKEEISYPDEGSDVFFEIEEFSFWFRHRNNCILELIREYNIPTPFFDIGGGNGFVSAFLQKNNIPVILVEPSIEGVLNAQKRNLANIICASLNSLNISKNALPSVGVFDVLEHIEDDTAFLNTIYNYLSINGFMIITVPAFQFLWSNEDIVAKHYRRYSLKEINEKVKLAGFKIHYSTYFFSYLFVPIFIFRTIKSILRFNKNETLKNESNSHSSKIFNGVIKLFEKIELQCIRNRKRILFGTSCILIAQKTEI